MGVDNEAEEPKSSHFLKKADCIGGEISVWSVALQAGLCTGSTNKEKTFVGASAEARIRALAKKTFVIASTEAGIRRFSEKNFRYRG